MAQRLGLDLRQSQQLVMTPQLQQAIRLLQMSNLELRAHLEEQLAGNPLLDLVPGEESQAPPSEVAEGAPREPEPDRPFTAELDPGAASALIESGHENLYDVQPTRGWGGPTRFARTGSSGSRQGGPEELAIWETRLDHRPSLREHVAVQLRAQRAPAETIRLAETLAGWLDGDGYLRDSLDDIGESTGADPASLERALALIQACEPTGVGARNLAECLALQLAERGRLDPPMRVLLDNLCLVARGETTRLARLCAVADDELRAMLADLRTLDPKPGASFGADAPATVVPDVLVLRLPNGEWRVELNPETLPRLILDRQYAASIGHAGAEVRRYLSECRAEARWLIRSLDQRAQTILKVATEIVRRQEGFLQTGPGGLRPMTLREIADAVGVHESTASRVTANKYIATGQGIFEMKFLFTAAVGGTGEDAVSAEAVRQRIAALVRAEQPDNVLSDDSIVDILGREGLTLARRTVAKYRKALRIPSSFERRRRIGSAAVQTHR